MLDIFSEFRKTLDDIMLQAMHNRIVLYGYGYTGRFLKWYAEYYHSIEVDYIVSLDMRRGQVYDQEIFRSSLFNFNYKDVKNSIVWLAEPIDQEIKEFLETNGYIKNVTYFDFYEEIYGKNIDKKLKSNDIYGEQKTEGKDIQFLEWLEWKYQCDFVSAIERKDLEVAKEHGNAYRVTTQKEIFPILDKCHCIPKKEDAIFDYGCGKGGAIISFLDYGFERVGGVEYEPKIYNILQDNIGKLNLGNQYIECILGDAGEIKEELDKYNWFYFFQPFDNTIFKKCIMAICDSLKRYKRKIHIISIAPKSHFYIEETKQFRLTNQFTINTRQRVVDIYESYE